MSRVNIKYEVLKNIFFMFLHLEIFWISIFGVFIWENIVVYQLMTSNLGCTEFKQMKYLKTLEEMTSQ